MHKVERWMVNVSMLCPIIFNSNTIELKVHTSCYSGFRLSLCYNL